MWFQPEEKCDRILHDSWVLWNTFKQLIFQASYPGWSRVKTQTLYNGLHTKFLQSMLIFKGDFLLNIQTILENLTNIYLIKPTKVCLYILGYILTYLPRASGFYLFFFFPSLKSRPNFQLAKQICRLGFAEPMGTVTWSLHGVTRLCSQLCCHSQWWESTQGHQKSDCQKSPSFVSSEQLPCGFPFPLSSDSESLLLLPYLIRAYDRKAGHCLELLEQQSTAASSSCLSISIFVA